MKHAVLIVMVLLCFTAVAQTYELKKEGSVLKVVADGTASVVSANADAGSAFILKDKVYYLETKGAVRIRVFDIPTGKNADAVTIGMTSESGYVVKSEIVNIVGDPSGNQFFFTTKDDMKGIKQFMTWKYDVPTQKYDVYCDGKALSLLPDNTLEVLFTGKDITGEYQQKAYFNASYRKLLRQDDRVYGAIR